MTKASIKYQVSSIKYQKGFTLIRTLLRRNLAWVQVRTLLRRNLVCVQGFTLIELLVVISIIGILMSVSLFGLRGIRESSRDAKRKADMELIRSAVEIYKADCADYPAALPSPLKGDDSSTTCLSTNTYMTQTPTDPTPVSRIYRYYSTGETYQICASLEQGEGTVICGGSSDCGETCNYKVENP